MASRSAATPTSGSTGSSKRFDDVDRGGRALARDRARRVLHAARPVGLRQDDDAADDRRLRGADRGHDLPRRARRHRAAALQARRQHRLPELRALPAPHRSSRTSPSASRRKGVDRAELRSAGRRRRSSSSASPGTSKRKPRQLSGGQQQRVALARALVNQPARAAARRAARRARPEAAQADAARAEADPARGRDHLRLRHARPGGGDDDGRPDRGHEPRPDRAARRARPSSTSGPATAFVAGFLGVSNLLPGVVAGADDRVRLDDGTEVASRRGARRPLRPGRRRRPPGEDPARRRRPANALARHGHREPPTSASPRSTSSRRRAGVVTVYVQNTEPGARARPRPATQVTLSWSPDVHVRRRLAPRRRPNDRRSSPAAELLERAAVGGAALTHPRLPRRLRRRRRLDGRRRQPPTRRQDARETLTISNWPLYIDIDEKTKKHPTLDAFTEEVRRHGQVHRGRQRQRRVLRQDPGRSSRRASRSAATSSSSPHWMPRA